MSQAERWFLHELEGCLVPELFAFKEDAPSSAQDEIVSRIVDCYHAQKAGFASRGLATNADMWRTIADGYREFEAQLEGRDWQAVSRSLLEVCRGPLGRGFCNHRDYSDLAVNEQSRLFESSQFVDKLLALAEALGCCTVQNPEQGAWGYPQLDLLAILAAIETRLPMEVRPPIAGGGAYGMRTEHGVLFIRDLHAMYTASRAHDLLGDATVKTVCELGGGTGTLAYYLAKAGMDEVWVFDLPIVSLVQAYYVMKSLGPDEVWLYGEPPSPARVRLLPYWEFENAPDRHFALVINQDSLPEIEIEAALDYIRLIRDKGSSVFLSINQEAQAWQAYAASQSVVSELVERTGGFSRSYRFPLWMRAGYVEELYLID